MKIREELRCVTHHWLLDPPWTAVDQHIKGVCKFCGTITTVPATFEACKIDHRAAYHHRSRHNQRIVRGQDREHNSVILVSCENFWKSKRQLF